MADVIYNSFKAKIMDGSIDLDTDTIKVALVADTYVPDIDADEFFSTPEEFEVSGVGYTAGGEELTTKVVSQDDTDDEGVFTADTLVWADSTITARGAVIYKYLESEQVFDPTISPLICYIDFGEDKSSVDGNFTIDWADEGILNLG